MTKIKMTLMGLLVMMTFVVTPVIGAEGEQAMGGQEGHIRGSELMDKEVHDQQGNELGSVSDLVLSRQGEAEFLIVSEGGTLGIGGSDLTPIPWDQVEADKFSKEDEAITVQIDQQKFSEAPTFSDDEWETFTQGQMDQEVRGYYEQEGMQQQPDQQMQQDQPSGMEENKTEPPPMEKP